MENGASTQLGEFPMTWIHKTYSPEVYTNSYDYKALQKYLCQLNRTIPTEIWPLGDFNVKPYPQNLGISM